MTTLSKRRYLKDYRYTAVRNEETAPKGEGVPNGIKESKVYRDIQSIGRKFLMG